MANEMLEAYKAKGEILAERWSKMPGDHIRGYEDFDEVDFLPGVKTESSRALLAQLYENTYNWLQNLDESTRSLQVGSFEKYVFPILRALLANLVVAELVTVHPLDAPTGLIFYFEALYGSSKGTVDRGQKMYDVRRGPAADYNYTSEIIDSEVISTGDGATTTFAGTMAYTPIRSNTVRVRDGDSGVAGTQIISDNGNGLMVGDVDAAGQNTINYSTGAYNITFDVAPANGQPIVVDYEYNMEANANIPEIDLQLTSAPVTARPHKLRARWSIEAQQDFQAYHGISAEEELVMFMANEIAKEINYRILRHISTVAQAGNVTWDRTPPAGVPWIWHKESLYDALIQTSNLIFGRTQRVRGSWLVAGLDVINVLETLSKFERTSETPTEGAGPQKIGRIGRFDPVIADPTYPGENFLMGYKGSTFLDTGYVWAPYLPLYTTGTIVLEDMIARKGMMQRAALKVVNSNMYATGSVVATGGNFVP